MGYLRRKEREEGAVGTKKGLGKKLFVKRKIGPERRKKDRV